MLWKLVEICLLRAGPQDLPASARFLGLTLLGYTLVDWLISRTSLPSSQALLVGLLDVLLLASFAQIALRIVAKPERFNQTLAAMAGTWLLLGLLALPMIQGLIAARAADTSVPLLGFAYLGILVWSLLVLGHILRHALNLSMPFGVGIGLVYTLISYLIVDTLFPVSG